MKKKLIITFILLLSLAASNSQAESISIQSAEKAALAWLRSFDKAAVIHSYQGWNNHEGLVAHCFLLSPEGYIILSADSDLPPVIAYSFNGLLKVDDADQNPLKEMLVSDLSLRNNNKAHIPLQQLSNNNKDWEALLSGGKPFRGFQQWPPDGTTSTGGWLEISWNQTHPYNIFCPLDNVSGGRSLAGCPSVAMAMIIDYQKNLNATRFDDGDDYFHSYGGRQYWIDDDHEDLDFLSFSAINEYFDSIAVKYSGYGVINEEERAALIFACGVAARQVYSSGGSGTFGVNQAYDGYLRFGYTDAVMIMDGDTSLFTRMKYNMMDGIPAHYAVLSSTGQGGHNVVVDGYNTENYFHVNFGWGGNYNAWYLLPQELPYNLTITEGVIVDIGITHVGLMELQADEFKIYPNPSVGSLTIAWSKDYASPLEIGVYDQYGRLLNTIISGNMPAKANHVVWEHKLPDGLYFIRLRSAGSSTTQKLVVRRGGL